MKCVKRRFSHFLKQRTEGGGRDSGLDFGEEGPWVTSIGGLGGFSSSKLCPVHPWLLGLLYTGTALHYLSAMDAASKAELSSDPPDEGIPEKGVPRSLKGSEKDF